MSSHNLCNLNFLKFTQSFIVRLARQGSGSDVALDIGTIAAAGVRCIDKVVMVQETEYDDVIECHHSYSERCHTTYTTDYQPQQVTWKQKIATNTNAKSRQN